MKNKQQISVEVNNNRIMSLSQEKHDVNITLKTQDSNLNIGGEWTITPGDFVMLMNYYRAQKEKGQDLF